MGCEGAEKTFWDEQEKFKEENKWEKFQSRCVQRRDWSMHKGQMGQMRVFFCIYSWNWKYDVEGMEGSRSTHKVLQRSTDIDAGAAVQLRNEKKKDGKMEGNKRLYKWQLLNSPNKGQLEQPHTWSLLAI